MKNFNQYKNSLLNIWTCDHRKEKYNEINKSPKNINYIKYYTYEKYAGISLNSIEYFINEITCLLYPYLNNIKSDYIGFDHYSRRINSSLVFNLHKIDRPEYYLYAIFNDYNHLESHVKYWHITDKIKADMLEFICMYCPMLLLMSKQHKITERCNIFITKWEHYCNIAKFDKAYIDFIIKKYNLGYDYNKWKKHIEDIYINPNLGKVLPYMNTEISYDTFNSYRIYGFNLEFLNGLYISSILKGKFRINKIITLPHKVEDKYKYSI